MENTKVVLEFEFSADTWRHLSAFANLTDLMKRAAEKVAYDFVAECVAPYNPSPLK